MKVQLPPYVHSYPAPAVLIGCGTVEKPNLITCAWFGTVCSEPPTVSVSIRPERFSYPLVKESGEFTVNIPKVDQLDAVKHCGTVSGRDENKFETLGWKPVPCPPLEKAPMAEDCFLNLGCKVKNELNLGTHTIFIAEVVSIYTDESNDRPSGRPDPLPEEQVVYLDGRYWKLTPAE